MSRTRLRTLLEWALGAAAGLTVLATTLNAGALASLVSPADRLRFVFLAAFCAFAIAYVALERITLRIPHVLVASVLLFASLAASSALWSIDVSRTVDQALAFGVLLLGCALVAAAAGERPAVARAALLGIVAGAGAVGVGGFVLLAVDHTSATFVLDSPQEQRFRGLGANANTVSLLGAIVLPPALWLAACTRKRSAFPAGVSVIALGVTIALSGSRAGVAAAFAGIVVTAVLLDARGRVRVALAVAALALATGSLVGSAERTPEPAAARTAILTGTGSPARPPPAPPGWPGPLYKQVDTGRRGDVFSSGRMDAWRGAVEQAWNRPVAGFGFGNEDPAFIDRYAQFQGAYVENSFLGTLIQLGAAGAVLLVLISVACATAAARTRRIADPERRNVAAAAAGGAAAALVAALVQSYLAAPGSVGALPAWLALLVSASGGASPLRLPHRGRAAALAAAALALVAAVAVAGRVQAGRDTDAQRLGILRVDSATGGLGSARLTGFSLTTLYDCFFYGDGGVPYALQTCYDHSGALVDAIDRRGGRTHFWSLRYDPSVSPLHRDRTEIVRTLERIGAVEFAKLYLYGYPPYGLTDTAPVEVRSWLRRLGRPPLPAGRDSA